MDKSQQVNGTKLHTARKSYIYSIYFNIRIVLGSSAKRNCGQMSDKERKCYHSKISPNTIFQIQKDQSSAAGTPISLEGDDEACQRAKEIIEELVSDDRDQRSGQSSYGRGSGYSDTNWQDEGPRDSNRGRGFGGNNTSTIMISTSKMGRVIGKSYEFSIKPINFV